jgi:hypothetical protein
MSEPIPPFNRIQFTTSEPWDSVDAEPTVPEFVNEFVRVQADAEFTKREAEPRAAIVARVREALWSSIESQATWGYVSRDRGIIDVGMADGLDMTVVAEAAVEVFVELLRNPPTREIHPDGTETIRWPGGC